MNDECCYNVRGKGPMATIYKIDVLLKMPQILLIEFERHLSNENYSFMGKCFKFDCFYIH
jgi:hypothetical protein